MNYSASYFSNQPSICVSICAECFQEPGDLKKLCSVFKSFFKDISKIINIDKRIPSLVISDFNSNNMSISTFASIENEFEDIANFLDDFSQLKQYSKNCSDENDILNNIFSVFSNNNAHSRLEVYIFTTNASINMSMILKFLKMHCSEVSPFFKNLKKIKVVNCIKKTSQIMNPDLINTLDDYQLSHLIEIFNIELKDLDLKEFLKEMLNESSNGFENLQLVSANGSLEIKLDIFKRLLDPEKDFKHPEYKTLENSTVSLANLKNPVTRSIAKLKAVKFLKMAGICESLLFGSPLILVPTQGYRIKWNDQNSNLKSFRLLSSHMSDNDLALLCKLEDNHDESFTYRKTSFFVIMSSKSLESSSRLLMKAIVTRSLLLNDNVLDITNLENELIENESLTQTKNNFTFNFIQDLQVSEQYNPLSINDNLKN